MSHGLRCSSLCQAKEASVATSNKLKKNTNDVWHQQDALACTCGSPSNHATFANACNPSFVHAQNPSWVHLGEESLLSRRSRARKIPSHPNNIFLLINRFCGKRNTPNIHKPARKLRWVQGDAPISPLPVCVTPHFICIVT